MILYVAGSMMSTVLLAVGHVNSGGEVANHRTQISGVVGGIDIGGVLDRRHTGQGIGFFGRRFFRGLSLALSLRFRFGLLAGTRPQGGQETGDRNKSAGIASFHYL